MNYDGTMAALTRHVTARRENGSSEPVYDNGSMSVNVNGWRMAALTLQVNDMSVASPTWQVNGRRSMAALTRRLKGGVWGLL